MHLNSAVSIGAATLLFASCKPKGQSITSETRSTEIQSNILKQIIQNVPNEGQVKPVSEFPFATKGEYGKSPSPYARDKFLLAPPRNLDRQATDEKPLLGTYPWLHLNRPFTRTLGSTKFLFLSDQPEHIVSNLPRIETSPGNKGILNWSPVPKQSLTRVLMDHINDSDEDLRMVLAWVADGDGSLSVHSPVTSSSHPVGAGQNVFLEHVAYAIEARRAVKAGEAVYLVDMPLLDQKTSVATLEFSSTTSGQLFSALLGEGDPLPKSVDDFSKLPIFHSEKWSENEDKLRKLVPPGSQPARYQRLLNSFIHSRGLFPSPDRQAVATYRAAGWREGDFPIQVYSTIDFSPGTDMTSGAPIPTENRGNYGAMTSLRVKIEALPPSTKEVAVLVFNRGSPYGGRFLVTDGKTKTTETLYRLIMNSSRQVRGNASILVTADRLNTFDIGTLWRAPIRAGDEISIWTEPIINSSVSIWYLIVPLP